MSPFEKLKEVASNPKGFRVQIGRHFYPLDHPSVGPEKLARAVRDVLLDGTEVTKDVPA